MKDDVTQTHWSQKKETASSYTGFKILMGLSKVIPYVIIKIIAIPVSLFYFIFARTSREHSKDFLDRVSKITENKKTSSLMHFISFSLNLVEKMESWSGKFSFNKIQFQQDDVMQLVVALEQGQGALLICSHLGNAELLRALAEMNRTGVSRQIQTISIVDFSISPNFTKMIKEINPSSLHHIISAKDIGPDTVIILQQCIEAGGLVVIAGDRTSATTIDSYFMLPFLNEPAPFATGPFVLARILEAPCYTVFGLRHKTLSFFPTYKMHVKKINLPQQTNRRERQYVTEAIAQQFVAELEYQTLKNPHQWYNFYNFWAKPAL